MKKKGNFRKVVSGLLAGMTMLSTVLSPMTAYAAEIQPEEKPPLYEEVKDLLDEDEVVTAKYYEIETGSVFITYNHPYIYQKVEVYYLKDGEVMHKEIGVCVKEKYSKHVDLYVRDSNIDNKWRFGIVL